MWCKCPTEHACRLHLFVAQQMGTIRISISLSSCCCYCRWCDNSVQVMVVHALRFTPLPFSYIVYSEWNSLSCRLRVGTHSDAFTSVSVAVAFYRSFHFDYCGSSRIRVHDDPIRRAHKIVRMLSVDPKWPQATAQTMASLAQIKSEQSPHTRHVNADDSLRFIFFLFRFRLSHYNAHTNSLLL